MCLVTDSRPLQASTRVRPEAYVKASNAANASYFAAVAVSGETMAVGAFGESSGATGVNGDQTDTSAPFSGAVYIFVLQGNTWVQQAYLKASNTDPDDGFGYSVALSGNTLAVGAFKEDSGARGVDGDQTDNNGTDSGAVYLFERTGTNWAQQAYLKPFNTEFGEWFGRSVAISGDTVVVGAEQESSAARGVNGDQDDNNAPAAGAAYVFVRSGTNWYPQAYLKASNTDPVDRFGGSVAISGDTIAVAAFFEDSNAAGVDGDSSNNSMTDAGAVYVFRRTGTNWAQEAYLKASNPGSTVRFGSVYGDEFGSSVGLCGDTLVVGARNEASKAKGVNGDQNNNDALAAGAAYVFVRTGTNWAQQAYLKASNPVNYSEFGWSVAALSEDRVLVGAWQEWSNATGVDGDQTNILAAGSGAAYLFERTGTNWAQAAYLKSSNTERNDYFGWSAAGSGDILAIGAYGEDSAATGINGDQTDNSAPGAGAVYVFRLSPARPTLSMTPVGAGRFKVSWPSPSSGWNLQQSTGLTGSDWTPSLEEVSDNGATKSVTVDALPGQRFFRLVK
jgi:hypothetical protein